MRSSSSASTAALNSVMTTGILDGGTLSAQSIASIRVMESSGRSAKSARNRLSADRAVSALESVDLVFAQPAVERERHERLGLQPVGVRLHPPPRASAAPPAPDVAQVGSGEQRPGVVELAPEQPKLLARVGARDVVAAAARRLDHHDLELGLGVDQPWCPAHL